MSIQQMKHEATTLSVAERYELISYLIALGRESRVKTLSAADRRSDFLAWADRPRPRVSLPDAGRDTIYQD